MKKSSGCRKDATSKSESELSSTEPSTASSASTLCGAIRSGGRMVDSGCTLRYLWLCRMMTGAVKTGPPKPGVAPSPCCCGPSVLVFFVWIKIVQIERLDKILKDAQALVGLGSLAGVVRVDIFVGEDCGPIHDAFFDVNRHVEAHGQRNCVARTRVDLLCVAISLHDDPREERVVTQVVHHDVMNLPSQLRDDRLEQIVRQWPLDIHFLELHRDRFRFKGADKNREIASGLSVFENHDAKLRHQANADAINMNFNHEEYPEPLKCFKRVPVCSLGQLYHQVGRVTKAVPSQRSFGFGWLWRRFGSVRLVVG